jgi:hypothetical protein
VPGADESNKRFSVVGARRRAPTRAQCGAHVGYTLFRYRAERSSASFAGRESRSGKGEPPARFACRSHGGAGQPVNKMGQAYTENPIDRRGNRVP